MNNLRLKGNEARGALSYAYIPLPSMIYLSCYQIDNSGVSHRVVQRFPSSKIQTLQKMNVMFNETSSYFITYNLQVDNEFNIGI